MKNLSAELKESLSKQVTSLCYCLLITLQDNTKLGFTSHDIDLEIDGIIFYNNSGLEHSEQSANLSLNSDIFKIFSILDSDYISEEDIKNGKFNNSKIEYFLADYNNLDAGKISLKAGYITRIISSEGFFKAEIESLSSKLKNELTRVYSPLCNAKFCDAKCGFDSSAVTFSGTVTEVTDNRKFQDANLSNETSYFDLGKIKFTSGENSSLEMEVKTYFEGGNIELIFPLLNQVKISDQFEIIAGCDKRFETCINKFSNIANFSGFPHIPGTDQILKGVDK